MADRIWTKVTATGQSAELEQICAVMCLVDNGLLIEDYSDFELNGMYGELVDEAILEADPTVAKVSLFVPEEKPLPEIMAFLRQSFENTGISVELVTEGLREEDWAEGWKKYYHPIHIGRLTIVPAWEDYSPEEGEIIVRMDPGMAFGTGTHETTRLVMRVIEREIKGSEHFLDVGCGSGILSICASRMGARLCAAYDIDPVAVAVARDNIESEGLSNILCGESDLLMGVDRDHGLYDFAVANIVSDILLRMLPDIGDILTPDATLVLSGIIESRSEDLREALKKYGYELLYEERENDWVAMVARRRGN